MGALKYTEQNAKFTTESKSKNNSMNNNNSNNNNNDDYATRNMIYAGAYRS